MDAFFQTTNVQQELIEQLLGEQHLAGPTVPPVVTAKTATEGPQQQPQKNLNILKL